MSVGVHAAATEGVRAKPVEVKIEMVQRMVGPSTEAVGISGTDLGTPFRFVREGKPCLGFIFGDVSGKGRLKPAEGEPAGQEPRLPPNTCSNALAFTYDLQAADGLTLQWVTDAEGLYKEVYTAKREDYVDSSTVPGGAFSLGDTIYAYLMQMIHWASHKDPGNYGRCLLVKSTDEGDSFEVVPGVTWGLDGHFVNVSPVVGPAPEGPNREVVYLFGSGRFREAPIYLAWVETDAVERKEEYHYYAGQKDGQVRWATDIYDAIPIVTARVGELSAAWNAGLKRWMLMYFDYARTPAELVVRVAPAPWGPWSQPIVLMDLSTKYDWYQEGWGIPYGGYLCPDLLEENGRVIYFTLSLWKPYSVFLMKATVADGSEEQ